MMLHVFVDFKKANDDPSFWPLSWMESTFLLLINLCCACEANR